MRNGFPPHLSWHGRANFEGEFVRGVGEDLCVEFLAAQEPDLLYCQLKGKGRRERVGREGGYNSGEMRIRYKSVSHLTGHLIDHLIGHIVDHITCHLMGHMVVDIGRDRSVTWPGCP